MGFSGLSQMLNDMSAVRNPLTVFDDEGELATRSPKGQSDDSGKGCRRAFLVPYLAAKPLLPPQPPPDPEAPGPFRLADPDNLHRMLAGAGFSAIAVRPHDDDGARWKWGVGACRRFGPQDGTGVTGARRSRCGAPSRRSGGDRRRTRQTRNRGRARTRRWHMARLGALMT